MYYPTPQNVFTLILNVVYTILLIIILYIPLYRIPKALIKFAIRTYFEEKRLHDLMCAARPGSQPTPTPPPYQVGQHSHNDQG